MKIFLVTVLLTGSVTTLILMMDLILGTDIPTFIIKLKKPYEVPEPAEYAVVVIFLFFIITKAISDYLKKKNKNNSSTN